MVSAIVHILLPLLVRCLFFPLAALKIFSLSLLFCFVLFCFEYGMLRCLYVGLALFFDVVYFFRLWDKNF